VSNAGLKRGVSLSLIDVGFALLTRGSRGEKVKKGKRSSLGESEKGVFGRKTQVKILDSCSRIGGKLTQKKRGSKGDGGGRGKNPMGNGWERERLRDNRGRINIGSLGGGQSQNICHELLGSLRAHLLP